MTLRAGYDLLRRVRDELEAARFAIAQVLAGWSDTDLQRNAERSGVTNAELRRCARNLQITFTLRLFCEFEGILRDYWRRGVRRSTSPEMLPLMEAIAHRRRMNADDLSLAHEVREYRNDVIHENLRAERFDFSECSRALGKYLRWLPQQW